MLSLPEMMAPEMGKAAPVRILFRLATPSQARYTPPAILIATSSIGMRATRTANPRPAAVACVLLPNAAPAAAARPPRHPDARVLRTTTAVVAPGVMTSAAVNER